MTGSLETAKARIAALDEQFRARTLRERLILTFGAAACVFLLIDHLALQPISDQRKQIENSRLQVEAQIEALGAELASLTSVQPSDEDRQRADEIRQLEEQLAQIESRLAREVSALVPPEAIVALLEEILEQIPGLELIRVESQPPRRLGQAPLDDAATIARATATTSADTAAAIVQAGPRLFRHGLEIEVAGSYPATLEYVERLEASDWNLLWDRLELEVVKFPKARVRIDLHTISSDEEWIGV